jgi:non-ribosomal peptide synthetase component F
MDLCFPRERLAYLMEDSGARLLLSQGRLVGRLPSNAKQHLLVDTMLNALGRMSAENPALAVSRDAIAQITYISSSAGVPRGVFSTHAEIQLHTEAADACGPFTTRDCWALLHSLAGELGGIALWGAFLRGAKIVVATEQATASLDSSVALLRDHQVTVLAISPAELRDFAEREGALAGARVIILAGGPVDPQHLKEWSQNLALHGARPQIRYFAQLRHPLLGVGVWRPEAENPELANTLTGVCEGIGISLLTEDKTTPVNGEVCDVFLSGPAVDAIAAQHAELAPQMVRGDSGQFLLNSGQLGALRSGGLVMLGPKANVVLTRGYLVDLGEIEALLIARPDIAACAVIAKNQSVGDLQLHAYIIPQGERKPTQWELRDYLGHYVPDFMTPGAYHFMESFPESQDGQLDRVELAKLPRPRW